MTQVKHMAQACETRHAVHRGKQVEHPGKTGVSEGLSGRGRPIGAMNPGALRVVHELRGACADGKAPLGRHRWMDPASKLEHDLHTYPLHAWPRWS